MVKLSSVRGSDIQIAHLKSNVLFDANEKRNVLIPLFGIQV